MTVNRKLTDCSFCAVDVETTGLFLASRLVEIGDACRVPRSNDEHGRGRGGHVYLRTSRGYSKSTSPSAV